MGSKSLRKLYLFIPIFTVLSLGSAGCSKFTTGMDIDGDGKNDIEISVDSDEIRLLAELDFNKDGTTDLKFDIPIDNPVS